MKNSEAIKECRAEAKKHGLTFKRASCFVNNGEPAYLYARRLSGESVSSVLTLSAAYERACSGELANYNN